MPIVREADGLAMSSRNAYLDAEQRRTAAIIHQTRAGREPAPPPAGSARAIEADGSQALAAAGMRPEYFTVRRRRDLGHPTADDRELIILTAAWLGSARLIDNVQVELATACAA